MSEPQWLEWARQLQFHAQSGLTYAENPYDIARYRAIQTIAAEIMASQAGADPQLVRDLFAGQAGYATPKLDTRGVVYGAAARTDSGSDTILLVKERSDGLWTLPGGWADVGDTPSAAVEREIYEESGYKARAVKLLMVYDRDRHGHPPHPFHIWKLFIRCELVGGAPSETLETDGVAFFREDELPALSLTRNTPAEIHRLFEHHRHPDWPTDFD
jgi:ADP-ribose pyrophosphatase YjhB (NUDIX family)